MYIYFSAKVANVYISVPLPAYRGLGYRNNATQIYRMLDGDGVKIGSLSSFTQINILS